MVFSLNSYCTIINLCTNDIFLYSICCIIYVDTRHYVRDTQMIMQALLRILFYMSPILWVPKDSGIGGTIGEIIKFNPVYFLAESYRAAILFHEWYFIEHWKLLLYNVIVILIFFVLGSIYIEDIAIISQISYNLKSLINVDAFIKDFYIYNIMTILIYNFYNENMRGKCMRLIIKKYIC